MSLKQKTQTSVRRQRSRTKNCRKRSASISGKSGDTSKGCFQGIHATQNGGCRRLGRCGEEWCRLRDSNTRPPHYECGALPAELRRLPKRGGTYVQSGRAAISEMRDGYREGSHQGRRCGFASDNFTLAGLGRRSAAYRGGCVWDRLEPTLMPRRQGGRFR